MIKYVLIISQYYHSYVQVICAVEADIIDKARKMIEELETYKRLESEEPKPFYYGDISDRYAERTAKVLESGGRINLNDAGDIYFEFSDSIMHLVNEINYYIEQSRLMEKVNRGRRKQINRDIATHHSERVVMGIIKKYFQPV